MNKTILFSPVGGTDPISESNYYDGSLLHICRVYPVDQVIMYMSKEICENHEKDDRYLYCLRKLAEQQGRTMEYELIQKKDLTDVHNFDFFYQEFSRLIKQILSGMDKSDTLLLNISSGTPGMKSALFVLSTLGEFACKFIQVSTPKKSMNEHIHRDFDVEVFWEADEDNKEGFENRCQEVVSPALMKIKDEEVIKKHVLAYDYHAAMEVAETMLERDTAGYKDLLQMAAYRLMLDFKHVDAILGQRAKEYMPVRSGNGRKDFEYALGLEIRLKRQEYADFIRAITPLIVDLFELILKKQCGMDVDAYCTKRNGVRKWDRTKLSGTEWDAILCDHYADFRYDAVKSDGLKVLIMKKSGNAALNQLVAELRNVESTVRNLAAHQIVSISDEEIYNITKFHGKQIMDRIKKAFAYTGIDMKKEYWDSYDEMNKKILAAMEQV